MTYLMWYDDSRRPVAGKLAGAVEAYTVRFRVKPTVALMSEADLAALGDADAGIEVKAQPYIRPNNFWIGINGADQ